MKVQGDMGFHRRNIPKGEYGKRSKVREELEEAEDAEEQGINLLLLFELSDMIGAIGGVAESLGWDLDDLVAFAKLRSKVIKEEGTWHERNLRRASKQRAGFQRDGYG
jgi:hypothetical protein